MFQTAYKNPHNESTMHDNGVDRAYEFVIQIKIYLFMYRTI